jgi:hypothetical protein
MPRDLACLFVAVDFAYIQIDMTASRRAFILPDRQVFLHFCNDPCLDGPARDFTFPAPACTLLRLLEENLHERVQTRIDVRLLDAIHE